MSSGTQKRFENSKTAVYLEGNMQTRVNTGWETRMVEDEAKKGR